METTSPAPAPVTIERSHATAPRSRLAAWWRGPTTDPRWARPAFLGLLLATTALYLWNLTANEWANSFYTAAAQAGSQSWTALFYGSSDAASAITVDKPPASLWVMGLSVRIFGLNSAAILVPQVLMGVASVGVVHASVRRHWGAPAGLLAGTTLALTPVAALMFRFNNPDALLVLLMTLAAWATMRAIEKGAIRWFALAGILIGLGFLTKSLQVLLVVPFFGIAFLVAADTTLRRRVIGAVVGTAAMLLSAGWWVMIVELVPASMRPYIGGSQTNSFLELAFGYNGVGRLNGEEVGSVGGASGWGETGITRMFDSSIGGQVSWLIPSALILLVAGLWLRGRAPRTDIRRAGYLVWGGWLLVTMATFSLMAGIFHEYYTVALAPAVAALVGMGAAEAWERRESPTGSIALSAATAAGATWGFILLSRTTEYGWLRVGVLATGMAAAVLLLVITRVHRRAVSAIVAAALIAALAGPAAYTASTLAQGHSGSIVTAGPATSGSSTRGPGGGTGGTGGPGGAGGAGGPGGAGGLLDASTSSTEVISALSADADSYTWAAAAIGSQSAAGLQIGTQLPVMAVGGFNGSDPSPTLEQFQTYVEDGRIHYFVGGGDTGGGARNGSDSGTSSQISAWVSENFTEVTIGDSTLYDLTQPLDSSDPATDAGATDV
ncbi:ArnT family glycosyltransferase [Janibacter sp. GS2]|uniref:ArnT family glycosyltransferase n=1 Tax=Janibacter sp. GS2 TaxID=3442646 RepID=UPI003EBE0AF6